jgi:hypothetical protein
MSKWILSNPSPLLVAPADIGNEYIEVSKWGMSNTLI